MVLKDWEPLFSLLLERTVQSFCLNMQENTQGCLMKENKVDCCQSYTRTFYFVTLFTWCIIKISDCCLVFQMKQILSRLLL